MTKIHPMANVRPRRPQLYTPSGAPVPVPTVALGYPYGPISAVFMHSLLALRAYEFLKMARGLEPNLRDLIPEGGIYVDQNRNRIVEKFMATDSEWLLQIDTDIEFQPTLLEHLLATAGSDKKVLAASVPLGWSGAHGEPLPSCGLNRLSKPGQFVYVAEKDVTSAAIQVDAVASAVLLVHREVFEAIADREGRNWFLKMAIPDVNDATSRAAWKSNEGPMRERKYLAIGEDISFCRRAEDAGYRSWLAHVPGVRHYKTVPLTHDREPATEALEAQ